MPWPAKHKILLRFALAYFSLLFLPGTIETLIPFSSAAISHYGVLWHPVVRWMAVHIFDLSPDIPYFGAEIDNSAAGLILWLCYLLLAIAAGLIWFRMDRHRSNDDRLHQWLRLLLRVALALVLIRYGTAKVIPTQMIAPPPLGMLTQRVGELTPMRLLWVFTGVSPPYESLTGLAELLAGALLLIPRTVLLGSLVAAANMAMVVALNLCYDVPVKLLSLHLLGLAIILMMPDRGRLASFFLLNRCVGPSVPSPLFDRAKWEKRIQVFVLLAGSYAVISGLVLSYRQYQKFHPPRPPYYGVWSVDRFTVEGKDIPMFSDPQRWRWVTFQRPDVLSLELMIGSRHGYQMRLDENSGQMILSAASADNVDSHSRPCATFHIARTSEENLVLDGTLEGRSARLELHRLPLRSSFHWVFVPPREE
jgi:uncharacterized membrane protein YphA (DoxX/SURF4 family)